MNEENILKNHFKKYFEVCEDIKSMFFELQFKKDKLYDISGQTYEDFIKSSSHHVGIEDHLDEIFKLERKIEKKELEKNHLRETHMKEIERLSKKRSRKIIQFYYLDFMPISKVAKALSFSIAHTKRLKKTSEIEFLQKMIPNDTK